MNDLRYDIHSWFDLKIASGHTPKQKVDKVCADIFDRKEVKRNTQTRLLFLLDVQETLEKAESVPPAKAERIKRECARRVAEALGLTTSTKIGQGRPRAVSDSELIKLLDMFLFKRYGCKKIDDLTLYETFTSFFREVDELPNKTTAWNFVSNLSNTTSSAIEKRYKSLKEKTLNELKAPS
ncbi:hypothetical protein L3Q72_11790 [Vibrio sp. JC009]|uniref:hypothetical protein n=1 Tax=Vibrio sp. JC009 TaxID=2912314 RepID=UPI0023AEE578|nr:hypothetical protein [Vibrio sp. JC009]WED21314.1 hypothetical protein L3Q72_11790 [Vibrio sp. JC009]